MSLGQQETTDSRMDKKKLLQQAKKTFVQGLLKHITTLDQLLGSLEWKWDLEQAKHIYHIVHTLKGSSPMFGFHSVGEIAQSLNDIWEWAQQEIRDINGKDLIEWLPDRITVSRGYVMRLKQEYEACLKEMKLDEIHLNDDRSLPPLDKNRLLLIDDDDVFRSYMVEKLRLKGYQVEEASSVAQAKKHLQAHSFDLITLDLLMYPESGYQLFEFLRQDPTLKWLPIIVLSGRSDIEDKVRCLRLGADDYVVKPFQFEELEARIYRLLTRSTLLEQLAFRDPLTGIYNRRHFNHQLEFEVNRVERSQQNLSIAFIDIDHFKNINDTFGHQMGDLVLQAIANVFQHNLRSADLLARYGGEEFVVLFPDTVVEHALQIIERILQQVRDSPILQNQGKDLHLTFSAGISGWRPGIGSMDLIEMADDAAYQAKKLGRNRVQLSLGERSVIAKHEVQLTKKKVLVADDDPTIRSILKSKLLSQSWEIYEAADGEEALNKLREHKINLLILDQSMPKVNGFDVLNRVRSNPQLKNMRIMMLSGMDKEEAIEKGLSLGADDYISKPFSLPEIEMRVKRLLEI